MSHKKEEIIFGIYPVEQAINASVNLDKVFIQKDHTNPKLTDIINQLESQNVTINTVPKEKLNRLTRGNHQGVVAMVSPVRFKSLEEIMEVTTGKEKPALFLILDQISDVRNFGAILRTAECTGVDAVIVPKSGGA